MTSYCAFLGHQPALSVAEIEAAIPDSTITKVIQKKVAIFDSNYELKSDTIDTLGGTLILAREIAGKGISIQDIPKLLANELQKAKKSKVTFSLRTIGFQPKAIRDLYRDCKNHLKKQGRSSRYVGNERKAAQAVLLHEHDMLHGKQACELVVIRSIEEDTETIWIGRTIAAHNIDEYTKRDMEKPVRDTSVGLLPPKLAQTLLNFGAWAHANKPGSKPKKATKHIKIDPITVYDPFCGTGVIPIECLLRGNGVIASDISKKAETGTTKNLEWVRKEYKITKKDVPSAVFKHDATKAFPEKIAPDVLVTETTLGPNLTKRATIKEAQKMRTDVEKIEASFLQNAKEAFPNAPIVCTMPVWYTSKGALRLEKIWSAAEKIGYTPALPTESAADDTVSLIYRRPDQFVGREVVVFMPKE